MGAGLRAAAGKGGDHRPVVWRALESAGWGGKGREWGTAKPSQSVSQPLWAAAPGTARGGQLVDRHMARPAVVATPLPLPLPLARQCIGVGGAWRAAAGRRAGAGAYRMCGVCVRPTRLDHALTD